MKRLFHIALLCACALLGFVSNAEAQTDGDIVTISYNGNYLAVNNTGNGVTNKPSVDKYCYWRVTVSGTNTYTFESVTADNKYLNIPTSNNSNLTLGSSQNIRKSATVRRSRPSSSSPPPEPDSPLRRLCLSSADRFSALRRAAIRPRRRARALRTPRAWFPAMLILLQCATLKRALRLWLL